MTTTQRSYTPPPIGINSRYTSWFVNEIAHLNNDFWPKVEAVRDLDELRAVRDWALGRKAGVVTELIVATEQCPTRATKKEALLVIAEWSDAVKEEIERRRAQLEERPS